MIEEIIADTGSAKREIVVCTAKDIDNPMPDVVTFVRDKALSEASLHPRAASAGAATIIALRHDDSDTFTAAMAAAAANQQAALLQNAMRPLEMQMSQLATVKTNVAAARPLLASLEAGMETMEDKVKAAERQIVGMWKAFRDCLGSAQGLIRRPVFGMSARRRANPRIALNFGRNRS